MIDPSLVKTVGFIAALVGTVGSAAVLFLPRCLAKWEKFIRIAFVAIALLGIISNKIGDHNISTANGPRHMSPAEWAALSGDMRAFAGEEFTILNYTDEVEATELTDALKAALDKAEWRYSSPEFGEQLLNSGLTGVLIRINNASEEKTKDAAKALETDLTKKWIVSRVWPVSDVQKNRIAIHLFARPRLY
jgi:hypothetical protein